MAIPQPKADIRIVSFETRYKALDDGSMKPVDWAYIAPRGQEKLSVIPMPVPMLMKQTDGMWEAIQPSYEAWRKNEAMPETGTPLVAWSGINKAQVDHLKPHGIKTVEDVRDVTDGQIDRIRLPGMRELRNQARAWDASRDSRKVESALAAKDEQIAAMQAQIAELAAYIQSEGDEPAKKRGRPAKQEVSA